jgi:hypothetical protein
MDFRAVFPERVRGNPVTAAATWKAAIGPINFRTIFISSLTIWGSVFVVPDKRNWEYTSRMTHLQRRKNAYENYF